MAISDNDIKIFQIAVRENSTYDFSDYSINSLKRRLTKITEEYGADIHRLIKTITSDGVAMEEVVKKLTVNTTELFRDTQIWQSMFKKLLPRFSRYPSINIWHPGCSTGQEVYSMMILLDQAGMLDKANIYASDINTDVMDTARNGIYRLRFNREYLENYKNVFSNEISRPGMDAFHPYDRYFKIDEARDRIQMLDFLKRKPVYNKIDLVKDDNLFFVNFDIIVCRNVIIYFNYNLQNRVLSLFHRNLRDNGCLVLGMHESIIGPGTLQFMKEETYYTKRRNL